MKKRICMILVLLLVWILPGSACADLKRGSSGEEVESLQKMLFDMEYLFEDADGMFGAKTEEAVKEYQKSVNLEETGVVTDELMEKIYQDWIDYWDWIQAQLRLDMEKYAPFCYAWENEDGKTIFEKYLGVDVLVWNIGLECKDEVHLPAAQHLHQLFHGPVGDVEPDSRVLGDEVLYRFPEHRTE